MTGVLDVTRPLAEMKPEHAFFVGIDSDGCIFDTMEIKHKECFAPNTINHFGLQAVSKYAREAWEFVNLYSKWRGINRWPALIRVLDLLRERPEVQRRGVHIPELPQVRAFIASGRPLSNDELAQLVAETGDAELTMVLAWSRAVNAAIADMVHDVPPFPWVKESLAQMADRADMIVVSQTPTEALVREWQEHHIDGYARVIAGQEMGTKAEHIRYAAGGKYAEGKMLMIGDAPGDLKAAQTNNCLFYPIVPGREEACWERFFGEAMERFFCGTYDRAFEASLIQEFDKSLPDTPPWQR